MTVPVIPSELDKMQQALSKYSTPSSARERPLWINNLLFGFHKVGKTIAMCNVPGRKLLFACDNGWVSLKDWPELGTVQVDECQGIHHFEIFSKALQAGVPLYEEFNHIIIDPFSKLVDERLVWQNENLQPSKQGDNRTQWTVKASAPDRANAHPTSTSGLSDYQLVLYWARQYVYPLFRLPKHITLIAHVRDPGFSSDKELRASVPGKTHEMIAREVDLISYMQEDNGLRTISFKPGKNLDAGSRFRELHGKVIKAEQLPGIYEKYGENNNV